MPTSTGQDTVTWGQLIVQGAGPISALRVLGLTRGLRFLAKPAPPVVKHLVRAQRAKR